MTPYLDTFSRSDFFPHKASSFTFSFPRSYRQINVTMNCLEKRLTEETVLCHQCHCSKSLSEPSDRVQAGVSPAQNLSSDS